MSGKYAMQYTDFDAKLFDRVRDRSMWDVSECIKIRKWIKFVNNDINNLPTWVLLSDEQDNEI